MCVCFFVDDLHAPVVQAAAASGGVGERSGGPAVPWRARQHDERRALRGGESVSIQLQQHLEGAEDKVRRGRCLQIGICIVFFFITTTTIIIIYCYCYCYCTCSKYVCTIHILLSVSNSCFFAVHEMFEISCIAVDLIEVSLDPK